MRPRTKIDIPEPKGTEFENFDRLVGIIAKVKVAPKRKKAALKKKRNPSKPQA